MFPDMLLAGQGRALEQMGLAPPPGLYPDLKSVRPPPYVPQQDLQQVQVMVKDGMVEVEIDANCCGPEDSGPREGDTIPDTRDTTQEG